MKSVASRSITLLAALALFLSAIPPQSRAAVPRLITYQGYLANGANAPVTATLSMVFRLWDLPVGGTALHAESQTVTVSGGIFNVVIGSAAPLTLPFDVPYYLGVTVEADAEMTPRQPMSAAPYAMRAAGVDATAALPAAQITGTVATGQLGDGSVTDAKIASVSAGKLTDVLPATAGGTGLAASGASGNLLRSDGATWTSSALQAGDVPDLGAGYIRNMTSPQPNSNFNVDGTGVIGGTLGIGTAANPGSKLTVAGMIETTNGGIKFADGSTQTTASIPAALDPAPVNTLTTIDSAGDVGKYSAITIGLDRSPVISYFDATNHSLKVAKCANAACTGTSTITTVDSTAGTVGQWSSITIGAEGFPVISYYDTTTSALKVAKCINPACTGASTITTVDNMAAGEYTSITLGIDGLPVISYYSPFGGGVSVAKCTNAACTGASHTTLDNSSGGKWTSIALGWDGYPIIAFMDGQFVKVAKCAKADCSIVTYIKDIEAPTFINQPSPSEPLISMAIGPDAIPTVSYYAITAAPTAGRLRVARCGAADCIGTASVTTVDATSDVGYHGSIVIGVDGLPVISYYDRANSNRNLKVVKCTNATCTGISIFSVVDSVGDVGQYTSITVGADGLPVISYYDATNHNLKVAKCGSASCGPILRRR